MTLSIKYSNYEGVGKGWCIGEEWGEDENGRRQRGGRGYHGVSSKSSDINAVVVQNVPIESVIVPHFLDVFVFEVVFELVQRSLTFV